MSGQLSLFSQTGTNSYGFTKDGSITHKFNKDYPVPEAQLIFEPPLSMITRPKVYTSEDSEQLFRKAWPKGKMALQEHFYMMMLNRNHLVLGISQIGVGGIAFAPIDLKLVFATALKACSSVLIFAHNHPSGNLEPSKQDLHLTEKLIAAGKILDIQIADHLILSPWEYLSMADQHLLPEIKDLSQSIECLQS